MSKSIWNRIAPIWPSRKLQQQEDGLKIACLLILQSRGWAYEWYVFYSEKSARADSDKGGEKYQQAFYVFEELAQAPATSSIQSLISQAVAEIHLGRLDEAEAALKQALAKDPKNEEVISNSIVLNVIQGKDTAQLKGFIFLLSLASLASTDNASSDLQSTAPKHHFLTDLQVKSALFDKAATKYSAKVAA